MNKNELKEKLVEDLKKYVKAYYPDYQVKVSTINKVNKNNSEMIGVLKDGKEGPAIELDVVYSAWFGCKIYEEVRQKTFTALALAIDKYESENTDYEKIKPKKENFEDRILLSLVNAKKNEEMLKKVPHRMFHEFAVVYRYVAIEDSAKMLSVVITNNLAKEYGLSEEDLYLNGRLDLKDNVIAEPMPMMDEMITLTTKRINFGAAAILDKRKLVQISEKYDSNLFLIHSSVEEWIVLVENKINFGLLEINEMIECANRDLEKELILGEKAYYYDRKTNKIKLAE